MQYKELFERFDLDKDGMVSYAEFSRGLPTIIELSAPVRGQLYALMDKHDTGLISYE
jgi:Ca2+-binding EF-hand superfamily protein